MIHPAVVIGGGPAGLMAAEVLARAGRPVEVFEGMPSPGRKFLMAGRGGLNLTHSEPFESFLAHYGAHSAALGPHLESFPPEALRSWSHELGIETFVGSSDRVFPVGMKSSPMLRAWLARLRQLGIRLHTRHRWLGWRDGDLVFATSDGKVTIQAAATVLALGGASWPRLGSRGDWVGYLEAAGVRCSPFRPANCGFDVDWSGTFRTKYHGRPLKSVLLSFEGFRQVGEFIITQHGIEGSLVYAASARLRDALERGADCTIILDLSPAQSLEQLVARLSRPRGSRTLSSHIERATGLKGAKLGLIHEFVPREKWGDPLSVAGAIKALRIPLLRPRPVEEAISSAGGVRFEELSRELMLLKLPGVFCAGEMLDWEAPTGGYLLSACFATGRAAGLGALRWMESDSRIPPGGPIQGEPAPL